MQVSKASQAKPRKKSWKRILKLVLLLAIVLIVLVVFLVPAFVSSEKARRAILAKINNSIDGKANFATLSMSWVKGVKIADLSYNDSGGQISVAVEQIVTKPHYSSILTGSLSFGKTIIDEPKVEINLKGRQSKKAGNLQQESSSGKKTQPIAIPIKKIDLIVNRGNLKVTDSKSRFIELSQINSRLNWRPPGQKMSFDIGMAVVDEGGESRIGAEGEFHRTVEGNKTRLQGWVDCEYDWSFVNNIASQFLPEALELTGKRKTNINFTSQYPCGQTNKLLANLSTKGKIGFEKAEYMGLKFGPTEVDIHVQDGLLRIAPFSTKVNAGQFRLAGEVDFKQEPVLFKTAGPIQIAKNIRVDNETTRKLLMYINPIFANAVNVSGVANFSCEQLVIPLAGAKKTDIVVIGTISIGQLRLQASDLLGKILSIAGTDARAQSITVHPTRFVLQNGFLQYDDMQMDIGDNAVNFKGVIGLDKSLNMKVTLPYTLEGRTARTGKESVGERVSLPLRGTIEEPELDLGKLLEEQLKKRLEKELIKGLEELFK